MRWRVLIVFLASLVLIADGRKRRPGSRALDKKSSASTPKTGAGRPSDKQGSRYVYTQQTQGKRLWSSGGKSGIKAATVDASVVAESTGEGGFIVGTDRSRSKRNGTRTEVYKNFTPAHLHPTEEKGTSYGDLQSAAGSPYQQWNPQGVPLFNPGQWKDLFGTKSRQTAPGSPMHQTTTGAFMPPMIPGYIRPQVPPGPIYPQAAMGPFFRHTPAEFFTPQSSTQFTDQYLPGSFMGQTLPGSFMPNGLEMLGTAGGNYRSHQYDRLNMPPTLDPGAGMYGSGAGMYGSGADMGFQNGAGYFHPGIGSGMGMHGTGPGMYGPQLGARANPTYEAQRELHPETRENEIPKGTSGLPPKNDSPTRSASSRDTLLPSMLLEELLSQRGEKDVYENIKDITWSTVEAENGTKQDENKFTVIAEFTSLSPPQTVQCSAVITGSQAVDVMRLIENESDVDCTPKQIQAPKAKNQHQWRVTSGNLGLQQPVPSSQPEASGAIIPINYHGYHSLMKGGRKKSLLYANVQPSN